jgi:hypothetical protein
MSMDVSEVRVASIIRALMMETARTSEIIGRHSEDSELHTRRRENLKSDILKWILEKHV